MKKSLLIILLVLTFTGSAAHAAIITVDNKAPSAGQYSTLQAAHDAAGNGDSIYVYPSLSNYTGITVTKQLHFIGTGFDKPATDLPTTNISGTMSFSSAASGAIIEGFGGYFTVSSSANNIVIKRNQLYRIQCSNCTGIAIIQNTIKCNTEIGLIAMTGTNEALITNNMLINTGTYHSCTGVILSSGNITFIHNILKVNANTNAMVGSGSSPYVANNIFLEGSITVNVSDSLNNMCNSSQFPAGNGNICNMDMNAVFLNPVNNDFHLLPNSPARGAGQNGVDMGIYGGSIPYVDGGRPGLPLITEINSDFVGSQQGGLDVTIKAKSNKD